jgi:hypothetical protein
VLCVEKPRRMIQARRLCSLAAARLFRQQPGLLWSRAIKEVCRLARLNIIRLGDRGQEHVRIAATVAVDFAIEKQQNLADPASSDSTAWFMLSVYDWLAAFLGPDCVDHTGVRDWSKRHWINFTHYARSSRSFTRSNPMTGSHLAEAWLRQVALIGDMRQELRDIVIVALKSEQRPKPSDMLDISKLHPIVIQIETRAGRVVSVPRKLDDLASRTYPSSLRAHLLDLCINLATATPRAKVQDGRCINVGCDAKTPLWVFSGTSNDSELSDQDVFTAVNEAESLLEGWRNCYHLVDRAEDEDMADFLSGAMYEETLEGQAQAGEANEGK